MTTKSPLPDWLATEKAVAYLFQLFGFKVDGVSIDGRQIDIAAQRADSFGFSPEKWTIEITTEMVGATKGSKDSQKLLLSKIKNPEMRLMLVSTAGFTDDQEATLKSLGIVPLTYSQLEQRQIDLSRYALNVLEELRLKASSDIGYNSKYFIEPDLKLRKSEKDFEPLEASAWTKATLENPAPSFAAVLGNLGSGKTSLLQRILEVGCKQYLASPNTAPIPVYIPLGRYKQHSGDIEQMLMSEFKRSGQESYPTGLVRYLLDNRRIILLLDGLDEVHPIQNSQDVLETIAGIFTSVGKQAAAVLSCRRQFFESTEEELAYFGSYTKGHLENVQTGITRILRGHPSTYIISVCEFDDGHIEQYLAKRCSMKKKDVEAFFHKFYGFKEMASTPVLLTMMATTIEEKLLDPAEGNPLPLLTLYRAYTDRWIERDMGRAKLQNEQRRGLSVSLASDMLWNGKESATWQNLREVLANQDIWKNNPLTNDDIERDIRNSGFLVRDLDNKYRFIHRSIMEYFAAVDEIRRLADGERPRHYPSDGFRLFLNQLISSYWIENGRLPFHSTSWNSADHGADAIVAQLEMVANASHMIPSGKRGKLEGIYKLTSRGALRFSSTEFPGLEWNHDGSLIFNNCHFSGTRIILAKGSTAHFSDADVGVLVLDLDRPDAVTLPQAKLESATASLQLPQHIISLADLKDRGATISISGKQWGLSLKNLNMFAAMLSRLKKGKIQINNFSKGAHGSELSRLFPELKRKQFISEDTSRQPHQLELHSRVRSLVGKLKTNPLDVQDEFLIFS